MCVCSFLSPVVGEEAHYRGTVLITGSRKGVGYEFAKKYAEEGWHVIACYRNSQKINGLFKLRQIFPNITLYKMDVTNERQIKSTAKQLEKQPIDIIINAASIMRELDAPFGKTNSKNMMDLFVTNAIAPLKVTEAFMPNLKMGNRKLVVMVSCKMGSLEDNHSGRGYAYRMSKAALNMAAKSMSIDLKKYDVATLLITPGAVRTKKSSPKRWMSPAESAMKMCEVIKGFDVANSGLLHDYRGNIVPY